MPSMDDINSRDPGRPRSNWILLGVLAALGAYLSWRILQPFATAILWAGVLALVFKPLDRWLVARTGRPNLAAAITLAVALFSVLLPIAGLSIALANEVGALMDDAPARWSSWVENPANRDRLASLRADFASRFPFVASFDTGGLEASVASAGQKILALSVAFAGNLLQGLARFVVVAFSLFFLLRDADKFEAALRHFLPLSAAESDRLLARAAEIVHASVVGVVAIAAVQGAIGGAAFALLGLPSPVLWGVAMAFFAMVPMVGAGLVWLPASVFLLATGETGKAITLATIGALVISTIDNFLRPRLVGGRTGLHELVVFFSVLGGIPLFGLVGLLVGPAILAITWALLDLFLARSSRAGPAMDLTPAPIAINARRGASETK